MKKYAVGAVARRMAVGLSLAALVTGTVALTGGPTPATVSCDASWPMFQHDPLHSASGCSTVGQTTVPTLHPAWFDSTGGSAVTDEPVVSSTTGLGYFGDYGGTFWAVHSDTGALAWKYSITTNVTTAAGGSSQSSSACGTDEHSTSYGAFPGTATVAQVPGVTDPMVFVGGGGTLYAFDGVSGECMWSRNFDPTAPTSSMEIESSPVYDRQTNDVIVGSDTNVGPANALPGVYAYTAKEGNLDWSYSPSTTVGCDDIWSSPALDSTTQTLVFGTGDCNNPSAVNFPEAVIAIDATTGAQKWVYAEPPNGYNVPPDTSGGGNYDDDFGMSPIIVQPSEFTATTCPAPALGLPPAPNPTLEPDPIVVEGGKTGYVYEFDELTGKLVNAPLQVAQPGNFNVGPGAIGGFIGSAALGCAQGKVAVFLTSAVFSPFAQGGIGGASGEPGGLTTFPDTTLANDPSRVASVHAFDVSGDKVLWQAPVTTPVFGPATYANGVVFTPSTTTFSVQALDADTGTQLWAAPLLAAPSGGVSAVGPAVFFGAGTEFASAGPL
ncbi:MAG TPA: PQQ-binding-like beta-propeller repeat protein, partial [Acidimicrobiales bacterium]|nr:PQQ-binding-like beta-propeller repeat protein [Acidimicrobiales bacterium]